MKVLIAVHHFPPNYFAGAELRVHRIAKALIARGHAVRLLTVEHINAASVEDIAWEDGAYDGIPVRRLSYDAGALPDAFRWSYDNQWIGAHAHRFFSEERPDVVHLFSGYLMSGSILEAARATGIPAVVSLTDFWFLCPRQTLLRSDGTLCGPPFEAATCARCLAEERRRYRIPGRLAPSLARRFWRLRTVAAARVQQRTDYLRARLDEAHALIATSDFLRDVFVAAGVRADRIHVIRQGRDILEADAAETGGTPAAALRLAYLGQLAEHKGVHVAISALRRIPGRPITLEVYGDPTKAPAYAAYLRRIAANDARIVFSGTYRGDAELQRILRGIDAVVVPSLWYESNPNVLPEAFALKKPVIASNLGSLPEAVVHDGNGLLFTAGDADSLAVQLQRLLDEPDLLATLRSGIRPPRRLAEEVDDIEAIYRALQLPSFRHGA